jgi:hypothetical protein
MSCFIVSPQTIHRIVEAAASAERYNDHERPYAKPFEALGYNLNQTSERQRLARDLFENNVAAFCDRYPPFEDAPESATTRYPEDIPPFSVVIPPAVLLVIAIQVAEQRGQNTLKSEAVERGFAEWVSDYYGNTTFVWKETSK